jgi:hypothetical protein
MDFMKYGCSRQRHISHFLLFDQDSLWCCQWFSKEITEPPRQEIEKAEKIKKEYEAKKVTQ